MRAPAVEARRVGYRVDGSSLVDGVDLTVRRGEVLGVVGPNGAGKSTLLRLMAGELAPSAGSVLIEGRDASSYRPRDLALLRAVMPQQTVLQFAFRAVEVVLMGRNPHRESSASRDVEVARRVMDLTDTAHLAERSYPTLSGGEQARVSFGRVLAQETPIVMLDEPTGSLDLRHQEVVMGILADLAARGAAVLAVLHDLNLAARYATRVGLMDGGRMVAVGATREVLREDLLSRVYRHRVAVVPHPHEDCVLVLPANGQEAALSRAERSEASAPAPAPRHAPSPDQSR